MATKNPTTARTPSATGLYWSERGEIACARHTPFEGSDCWNYERWAPVPREAVDEAQRNPAFALPRCETCGMEPTRMNDHRRFLASASRHAEHVSRIAARLLRDGKVGQGTHDALIGAAGEIFYDAYQAGRCEPDGVTDLRAELARVRS